MTLREHVHSRGFDHSALLYHSEREYVDSLMHFITEGLERQQPVLVAVPGDRLISLLDALGNDANDVTMMRPFARAKMFENASPTMRSESVWPEAVKMYQNRNDAAVRSNRNSA